MKRNILILLFIAFSLSTYAQEKLDVSQAIKLALENNYGIKVAKNTRKQAVNSATIGNAGLVPSLNATAGANYTDTKAGKVSSMQTSKSTRTSAGIELSYTLLNGWGNILNYKKLEILASGSNFQAKYIIEATVFNVISSFYSVCQKKDILDQQGDMLKISRERLARQEEKNKIGAGTSLQVLNARVDINKDSVNYLNAKKNLAESKRNLNTLLCRDIDTEFSIEVGDLSYANFNLQTILDTAFSKNSDYLLKMNKVEQSKMDLKIARLSSMPTISLKTGYGYNQIDKDFNIGLDDPNTQFTAGVNISLNIYDGEKKAIKKRNARLSYENSQYKLEEQKLIIKKDLVNAYANYRNTLDVLNLQKQNLKSAEMNFEQSKEYYRLGKISSTEYRQAQLNLLVAKNNISKAKYNAKIAEMNIHKLSGTILKKEL